MSLLNTVITANATGVLVETRLDVSNAYIFITAGSDLGGGTLTLGIRKLNSTDALIPIDTPIAGSQAQYPIGGRVELHYTLTGATAPAIEILASQGS